MTGSAPPPVPEEALAFFAGKLRVGYLATRRPDSHLAVVPVAVVVQDGAVRISSPAPTRKVRNMRGDPHVAVCIPDPQDGRRYLMIRGYAEVAEDADFAFIDWLSRTHMGLAGHVPEDPPVPRMVIMIREPRFVVGGTFEGH